MPRFECLALSTLVCDAHRRNGIQRWPRRELLRENKDESQASPMETEAAPVEPKANKPASQSAPTPASEQVQHG